jgi:hypothetical protein
MSLIEESGLRPERQCFNEIASQLEAEAVVW